MVFIYGFILVEIILLMSSIAELIHNIYKCRKRRRERNNESVAVSIDSFAVEEEIQDVKEEETKTEDKYNFDKGLTVGTLTDIGMAPAVKRENEPSKFKKKRTEEIRENQREEIQVNRREPEIDFESNKMINMLNNEEELN